MISQSAHFAPVFAKARDEDKPVSQAHLADLIEAREPMPASKSHVRRLKRERPEIVRANASVKPQRQFPKEVQFLRELQSHMGGTRTVEPMNVERYHPVVHVAPARNTDLLATGFMEIMEEEQAKIDATRERLALSALRERVAARGKLLEHAVAKAGPALTAAFDASLGGC